MVDWPEAVTLPMADGVLVDTKPIRQLARGVAVVDLDQVRVNATSAHEATPQPTRCAGLTPS